MAVYVKRSVARRIRERIVRPANAGGKQCEVRIVSSIERKLHDLLFTTPSCQLGLIGIDRKYPFHSIADALALEYDYCAYCFPPGLSQR